MPIEMVPKPVIEARGLSLAQTGRPENDDYFRIRPVGAGLFLAVADGRGVAPQAARHIVTRLEHWVEDTTAAEARSFGTWSRWVRQLDVQAGDRTEASLVALLAVGQRLLGVAVGGVRALVWNRAGELRDLSEGAGAHRVGSGLARPVPINVPLSRGELLVLMTDGAWMPVPLGALRAVVAQAPLSPLAELPAKILGHAGRATRADDMTVVVARHR